MVNSSPGISRYLAQHPLNQARVNCIVGRHARSLTSTLELHRSRWSHKSAQRDVNGHDGVPAMAMNGTGGRTVMPFGACQRTGAESFKAPAIASRNGVGERRIRRRRSSDEPSRSPCAAARSKSATRSAMASDMPDATSASLNSYSVRFEYSILLPDCFVTSAANSSNVKPSPANS